MAVLTDPRLQKLKQLEQAITYAQPPPVGEAAFCYQRGTRPVLLSAPHAAAHLRNGAEKPEEEYTAAFVRYLASKTGSHALFATHLSHEDPNWDKTAAYKQAIGERVQEHDIELIIDLHGMTNRHNIGVAIGTMNGRSIRVNSAELIAPFLTHDFHQLPLAQLESLSDQSWQRLVLNHPKFTGGLKNHTVTRFASQTLGIPAIQIEIASAARIVHRGPNRSWPHHYHGIPAAIHSSIAAIIDLITQLVPAVNNRQIAQ